MSFNCECIVEVRLKLLLCFNDISLNVVTLLHPERLVGRFLPAEHRLDPGMRLYVGVDAAMRGAVEEAKR